MSIDVAEFQVKVDTSNVVSAERDLLKLEQAGARTADALDKTAVKFQDTAVKFRASREAMATVDGQTDRSIQSAVDAITREIAVRKRAVDLINQGATSQLAYLRANAELSGVNDKLISQLLILVDRENQYNQAMSENLSISKQMATYAENLARGYQAETTQLDRQIQLMREGVSSKEAYNRASMEATGLTQSEISARIKQLNTLDSLKKAEKDAADAAKAASTQTVESVDQVLNAYNQELVKLQQIKAGIQSGQSASTAKLSAQYNSPNISAADIAALKAAREEVEKLSAASLPATERFGNFVTSVRGSIYVLAAYQALHVAQEVLAVADSFTLLEARIRIASKTQVNWNELQQQLSDVSRTTRQDIQDTGLLYARLIRPVEALGGTQQTTLAVTEAFNAALLIGGANTVEASSAILQFSQAMRSGRLAGDEFRTMSEAAPRVLQAIAQGSGIAESALKKMASEGFLTSSTVINALLNQLPELQKELAQAPVTGAQGWTLFTNEIKLSISGINETLGLSEGIGQFFKGLSDDIKDLRNSGFVAWLVEVNAELDKMDKKDAEQFDSLMQGIKDAINDNDKYLNSKLNSAFKFLFDWEPFDKDSEETMNLLKGKTPVAPLIPKFQLSTEAQNYLTQLNKTVKAQQTLLDLTAKGIPYKTAKTAGDAISHGLPEDIALPVAQAKNLHDDQIEALQRADQLRQSYAKQGEELIRQISSQGVLNKLLQDGFTVEQATLYAKNRQAGISDALTKQLLDRKQATEALAAAQKVHDQTYDESFQNQINNQLLVNQGLAAQEQATVAVAGARDADYQLAQVQYQAQIDLLEKQAEAIVDVNNGLDAQALLRQRDNLILAKQLSDTQALVSEYNNLIVQFKASSLTDVFSGALKPMGDMLDAFQAIGNAQQEYADNLKKAGTDQAKISLANQINDRKTLQNYAALSSAAAGFFGKNTAGYKTLTGVSKVFHAMELADTLLNAEKQLSSLYTFVAAKIAGNSAMAASSVTAGATDIAVSQATGQAAAVTAVAKEGAGGDPYSAFARMAAMAAIMAGLGFIVGGGFGGGGKDTTAADRQASQGTGSVLGDVTAQSESIAKSMEELAKLETGILSYSSRMLNELTKISDGINGLGALLIQTNIASGGSTPFAGMALGQTGAASFLNGISQAINKAIVGTIDKLVGGILGSGAIGQLAHGIVSLGGLASTVDRAVNNAIFGGKQTLSDTGIRLTGTVSDYTAQYYARIRTSGGMFSGPSYSNKYKALDAQTADQIGKVISGLSDAVLDGIKALGGDAVKAKQLIDQMQLDIKNISLKGLKGEDVQKQLTAVFSALGDRMAGAASAAISNIDLMSFQQVGEGLLQTLARVATNFEHAKIAAQQLGIPLVALTNQFAASSDVAGDMIKASVAATETFNGIESGLGQMVDGFNGSVDDLMSFIKSLYQARISIREVGINASALTSTLVNAAGGLDNLQSSLDTYQDKYFTDAEKAAAKTVTLTEQFNKLGYSLPNSKDQFKQWIKAIDTSTDAGQTLLGQMLNLASGFADLSDLMDSVAESTSKLMDALSKARSDAATPEVKLDNLLNEFNTLFATALGSSGQALSNASDQIAELIQPLLDQIGVVYASGQQAQDLRDYVLSSGDRIVSLLNERNNPVNAVGSTSAIGSSTIANPTTTTSSSNAVATSPTTTDTTATGLAAVSNQIQALVNTQASANPTIINLLQQVIDALSAIEATNSLAQHS